MSDRCPLGYLLAHLSQRLTGELIGYQWSSIRRLSSGINNFKHLLLQNRLPNQRQILCGASSGRGMKVCLRHLGHMTKMATTPIYGKNPSKIFFSRTGQPIFTKLDMQHRGIQSIIVCSNGDPGVTMTYFTAGNLGFSIYKSENSGFSETFAASALKDSRSRHLIEYMKVCEY